MNRRSFFSRLAGAVAVAAASPIVNLTGEERLSIEPPKVDSPPVPSPFASWSDSPNRLLEYLQSGAGSHTHTIGPVDPAHTHTHSIAPLARTPYEPCAWCKDTGERDYYLTDKLTYRGACDACFYEGAKQDREIIAACRICHGKGYLALSSIDGRSGRALCACTWEGKLRRIKADTSLLAAASEPIGYKIYEKGPDGEYRLIRTIGNGERGIVLEGAGSHEIDGALVSSRQLRTVPPQIDREDGAIRPAYLISCGGKPVERGTHKVYAIELDAYRINVREHLVARVVTADQWERIRNFNIPDLRGRRRSDGNWIVTTWVPVEWQYTVDARMYAEHREWIDEVTRA